MPNNSLPPLIKKLKQAYPHLSFVRDTGFFWSARDREVHYASLRRLDDKRHLLHEVGHALLEHYDYRRDIDLLKREREAWEKSREIAPLFNLAITDDAIEDALDTYRDWLHKRSLCPSCSQTGVQVGEDTYQCLICETRWRVNDARRCGLKRFTIEKQNTP